MPFDLSFVQRIPERLLIKYMLLWPQDRLQAIQDAYGINDCPVNCKPRRLPCPKHSTWTAWRREGLTAKEIVVRWFIETGEAITREEVKKATVTARKSGTICVANCDCPVRLASCPHIVLRAWYLPMAAQGVLMALLDQRYRSPGGA